MIFVEVVVNVPVRRIQATMVQHSRSRGARTPAGEIAPFAREPPDELQPLHPADSAAPADPDDPPLETFTYHLPPALEFVVQPGHLVWVPFRTREIQGIVVRLADVTEVKTREVLRLARPEPVLSEMQLRLAAWIAHYYVASMAEAVKLFLPPGLLQSSPDRLSVQSKREMSIELVGPLDEVEMRLLTLARDTAAGRVLAWFVERPEDEPTIAELATECNCAKTVLADLVKRGWMRRTDDRLQLRLSHEEARHALETVRGLEKYRRVLGVLMPGLPLWRSELYERVETDLPTLRALQRAGLLLLDERVRFRDPLQGRSYARTRGPPLTGEQAAA